MYKNMNEGKGIMKKIITALLCMAMVLSVSFASCSSNESKSVITYGDVSVNENVFFYMLTLGKTETLQSYSGATTDIPALWAQSMGEGVTFDDLIYLDRQLDIRVKVFFADYALQHNGALTSDEKKEVVAQMDTLIENFGTKAALNKYLEEYAMNYNLLKEYYELEALYSKGLAMAYSAGGEYEIPIEDAMKYYENNFVTVKHIAIGTEYAGTDKDGNYIYYTDDEKQTKLDLVKSITDGLASGESWEKYASLSEDGFASSNPDGYTIKQGVLDSSMKGYENVSFSLAVGEWDTFELEGVSTYIIKRVELNDADFENCYTSILSDLIDVSSTQAALDNDEAFIIDDDIINSYSMASVPVLK